MVRDVIISENWLLERWKVRNDTKILCIHLIMVEIHEKHKVLSQPSEP